MLKTRREAATRDCCDARLCNALRAKGTGKGSCGPLSLGCRPPLNLHATARLRRGARGRAAASPRCWRAPCAACLCARLLRRALPAHSRLTSTRVAMRAACCLATSIPLTRASRRWSGASRTASARGVSTGARPAAQRPSDGDRNPRCGRGAASCSALTRAPRAPGSCWACSRCWRAWATKPSSGACPLPLQAALRRHNCCAAFAPACRPRAHAPGAAGCRCTRRRRWRSSSGCGTRARRRAGAPRYTPAAPRRVRARCSHAPLAPAASARAQGAAYVYATFLAPLLQRHEAEVDRRLAEASARVGDVAHSAYARATAYAHARFLQLVASLPQQPQARGSCASGSSSAVRATG